MTKILPVPELLRLAGDHARHILLERRERQLMPSYVLIGADGLGHVVGTGWRNDDEKIAAIAQVRDLAREYRAVALSFVTEAWVTDTLHQPDALTMRPSEHPQRHEVVHAFATDKNHTQMAQWQIVRDRPGGNIIALVEDKIPDGVTVRNRLIDGILP